ncbi:MAG: M56 family metallopeptidase [Saprospiraceae bacterium]
MIAFILSDKQVLLTAWTWALIHSMWIGLVLAFMFYSFLRYYSGLPAKMKYAVGICLFTVLPISTFTIFIYNLLKGSIPEVLNINAAPGRLIEPVIINASTAVNLPWVNQISQYSDSIFLVYTIGVIILSLHMMIDYRRVEKLRVTASEISNSTLLSIFNTIYSKSSLCKPVKLVGTSLSQMPATLGYLKPLILMPVSIINQLTIEESYAIIAHEMAHIIRKDYLHNFYLTFIEVLFFFHPSVWWFSSTIKSIREQCCDDIAIRLGAEKIALSQALIRLEEQSPNPVFALAFSQKHQLFNRIQRLYNPNMKNEFNISRSQAPILICSLALLLVLFKPLSNMHFEDNNMSILPAFLWDSRANPDTTKPKIEKITKDNGKEKIELQLRDKKIEELRVNDQVIAPSDYMKYEEKTEALKKELTELETPDRRERARVYNDFDPAIAPQWSDDDTDNELIAAPRSGRSKNSKSRVFVLPGHKSDPLIFRYGSKDNFAFNFGQGLNGKIWPDGHDDIHWIFDGDSSGIAINGDRLIIKNDKGDIIMDLGEHNTPRAFAYRFPGLADMKEFENFPDDMKIKLKSKLKALDLDQRLKMGEFNLKHLDELNLDEPLLNKLMEEDHLHKLMDETRMKQKRLHEKLFDNNFEGLGENWKSDKAQKWMGSKKNLSTYIQESLLKDKLIKGGENYEFKIDDKGLRVNGKKQSDALYNDYKKLIEEQTGFDMDKNSSFMFSGSTSKDN